jgi:hypothetical protein
VSASSRLKPSAARKGEGVDYPGSALNRKVFRDLGFGEDEAKNLKIRAE